MRFPRIFSRHRPALEQKDSATGPLIYIQSQGQPVWTPRQYDRLAEEAYLKNVIAYRCVRIISEGAANIPWLLYKGEAEMEQHPLLDLLHHPNPCEGGVEMMERLYSFYLLSGNAYLEGVILDREISELWALRPDRIKITIGRRGYPSAYTYEVNGQKYTYEIDDLGGRQSPILHLKSFHPTNDLFGMSPVEAGAFAIDVHNSAGAYNKSLLDNQAKPSGAIIYTGGSDGRGTLSDEQFRRLKDQMEEKYQGTRNAGRPMLLDGGLEWRQMGMTPQDMEFTEGKREAAREVALTFGVPPMILGIPGDNTYSNYAEANRALYRQTILPMVGRFASAISTWAAPTWGDDIRLSYDIDEIPALSIEREAVWSRVQSSDWLTVNEKRAATGYSPYEPPADIEKTPGDALLVGATQVPLDDMGLTMGGDPGGGDPDDTGPDDTGGDDA